MPAPRVRVILNPKAASGRAAARRAPIEAALTRAQLDFELTETRGPGDATRLVHDARERGVEVVAVAGGDGTLNECVQAYLAADGSAVAGPRVALIPAGTGGDFRKTFGFGESVAEAVRRLKEPRVQRVDLGCLTCVAPSGEAARHAFINIMSFGIGGLTDQLVNSGPKWLGGKAAFFLGTLRALARYRNVPVRVTVDGEPWIEGPILNVAVANGCFFGGGMHIAPDADPSDGLFDVVALGDLSRAQSLALTPRIYQGTHRNAPQIFTRRGARVEAEVLRGDAPALIDNDGETPGRLPLSAQVLPGALELLI